MWKSSAEKGNLVAQTYLGLCYFTGDGTKIDQSKAVAIWTSAAEHGSVESLRYLGIAYASGSGINKDKNAAFQCFSRAAQLGDEESRKAADKLRLDLSMENSEKNTKENNSK